MAALRAARGGGGRLLAGGASVASAALSTTASVPFTVCAVTDWVARWACSVHGLGGLDRADAHCWANSRWLASTCSAKSK